MTFLQSLIASLGKQQAQSPHVGSQGMIVIGDMHGRLDLLDRLLAQLADELDPSHAQGPARLLFLGDYIDRGPASAGVLTRLQEIAQAYPDTVFLRGNHEQVLLDLLEPDRFESMDSKRESGSLVTKQAPDKGGDTPEILQTMAKWLRFGGQETLASYRVPARMIYANEPADLLEALKASIPAQDIRFLQQTALKAESGDYFFAHAGVHPDIALEAQSSQDLLWIREPFLSHNKPLARTIVHGHSISPQISRRAHRIGIDTGAYKSGCLTALVLRGTRQRFVQTTSSF
jgi:serine/threonine protein phosphatase 1